MAKRLLDCSIALLALIMLAPLMIVVAIMVAIGSKGPVLYGHERIGFNGRRFRCYKFRSMVTNGDEVLARHLAENAEARAEWAESRKLKTDPRITKIGRVLRELSIDELPQLFNVLAGDMSLVGPRPVVEDELLRYGGSRRHYVSARPGVTGLWQVSGRSDVDYQRRVVLDRTYVSNWTLGGDVAIIARTVPAVLKRSGSY